MAKKIFMQLRRLRHYVTRQPLRTWPSCNRIRPPKQSTRYAKQLPQTKSAQKQTRRVRCVRFRVRRWGKWPVVRGGFSPTLSQMTNLFSSAAASPFNLTRWFAITSLTCVIVISIAEAQLLSKLFTDKLLRRDAEVTMEFVQSV